MRRLATVDLSLRKQSLENCSGIQGWIAGKAGQGNREHRRQPAARAVISGRGRIRLKNDGSIVDAICGAHCCLVVAERVP